MRHRLLLAIAVAALLAAVLPGLAHAATIVVDSAGDDLAIGHCTLRDAIEDAVLDGGGNGSCLTGHGDDTIVFRLPVGSTIALTRGELVLPEVVANGIDIQGPGAEDLAISGGGTSRVFLVEPSVGVNQAISGLTIRGGFADNEGGGVLNRGELTLSGVAVEGNEDKVEAPVSGTAYGGGIASVSGSTLLLEDSTVAGNTVGAVAGGGLAEADGGAIFNQGALTVADSTIANNGAIAAGGGGQSAGGGGIATTTAVKITSSTIAGNSVISGALKTGANILATGSAEVENTIVAEPQGATSCSASLTSLGFNLEEEDSCGFHQATDQPGADPKLAVAGLADNGGPTPTIALEPGSPALDQGLAASGETTDQRGFQRPVALPGLTAPPGGDHADIGAYEQQAPETEETTEPGGGGSSGGGGGSSGGGGGTPPSAGGSPPTHMQPPTHTQPPTLKVRIAHLPARTTRRRVTIRFHANLPGARFRCALDKARPRPCHSPFKTKRLGLGRHTFTVRATIDGRRSKPATVRFRVRRATG
jgi:hypothetical protein